MWKICCGEPRNFANWPSEFGKICHGRLWSLMTATLNGLVTCFFVVLSCQCCWLHIKRNCCTYVCFSIVIKVFRLLTIRALLGVLWSTFSRDASLQWSCDRSIYHYIVVKIRTSHRPIFPHILAFLNIWMTRNTLDCDQSNVYSSRVIFSAIS